MSKLLTLITRVVHRIVTPEPPIANAEDKVRVFTAKKLFLHFGNVTGQDYRHCVV